MIVGVTGSFAAGKDTISDYLQKKGFFHFSFSDAIRRECGKRGLPKDRDTLRRVGIELGETFGIDILAKLAMEAVTEAGATDIVFTSIRRAPEVQFLKSQPGFILLCVDAPVETRFARIKKRQREGDEVDFDRFKAQEELEKSGAGAVPNLMAVAALADYQIVNDGSFEDLYKKVDEIIS